MKKLVLAYSGGLDTSYCAKYLSELGYAVHAVCVDTGGFNDDELKEIKEKAIALGVADFTVIDAVNAYYEKVIRFLIYGNVLKNNTYPLSVSAERIIQAIEICNYAKSIGADVIAHGSTGAGNDQVRFDLIFQTLIPGIEIITPIRDNALSRQDELQYLKEKGVDLNWEKAKYSINKGLWGTSVGGAETLTSESPLPESAFPSQLINSNPEKLVISFKKGEVTAVNGIDGRPVENIEKIQAIGSKYAIGRDVHVGDTILGIKGRVGFEAAGPLLIIKAHHLLEKHTLSKWQLQHKDGLANWYGTHLHEGLFLDPVMRNIESFLESSQERVSGEVFLSLHPYRFELEGIQSENDLMQSDFGQYGESNKAWNAEEVKGFIKIYGNQNKMYQQVNEN